MRQPAACSGRLLRRPRCSRRGSPVTCAVSILPTLPLIWELARVEWRALRAMLLRLGFAPPPDVDAGRPTFAPDSGEGGPAGGGNLLHHHPHRLRRPRADARREDAVGRRLSARRATRHVPVILVRTPYDNGVAGHVAEGKRWASRGYAYVVQDVRGRGESDGEFYPLDDRGRRWRGHDRVAGAPAVVHRQGRDDGRLVSGLGAALCGHS